jgi:hypothetical protein
LLSSEILSVEMIAAAMTRTAATNSVVVLLDVVPARARSQQEGVVFQRVFRQQTRLTHIRVDKPVVVSPHFDRRVSQLDRGLRETAQRRLAVVRGEVQERAGCAAANVELMHRDHYINASR